MSAAQGISVDWVSDKDPAALAVVGSNVAFLIASTVCGWRRHAVLAFTMTLVAATSSLYHADKDLGWHAPYLSAHALQLDEGVALLASSLTLMLLARVQGCLEASLQLAVAALSLSVSFAVRDSSTVVVLSADGAVLVCVLLLVLAVNRGWLGEPVDRDDNRTLMRVGLVLAVVSLGLYFAALFYDGSPALWLHTAWHVSGACTVIALVRARDVSSYGSCCSG